MVTILDNNCTKYFHHNRCIGQCWAPFKNLEQDENILKRGRRKKDVPGHFRVSLECRHIFVPCECLPNPLSTGEKLNQGHHIIQSHSSQLMICPMGYWIKWLFESEEQYSSAQNQSLTQCWPCYTTHKNPIFQKKPTPLFPQLTNTPQRVQPTRYLIFSIWHYIPSIMERTWKRHIIWI